MGRRGGGYRHHSKVVWPGVNKGPEQRFVVKVGRNDPCPCGADKKYKDCHEREGSAYLKKLADEQYKQERKELVQRMKEQGVPWFKRFLARFS